MSRVGGLCNDGVFRFTVNQMRFEFFHSAMWEMLDHTFFYLLLLSSRVGVMGNPGGIDETGCESPSWDGVSLLT